MTTACIIWLIIFAASILLVILGSASQAVFILVFGILLATASFLGFGASFLIDYERKCRKQEQARKKAIADAAARQQAEAARRRAEAARIKAEAERKRLDAIQAERERRKRYGWYQFSVAGVTFANDDGSSRQKILSEIYDAQLAEDLDLDVTLEQYEHDGSPAIHVLVNGRCVGNIPRMEIDKVSEIMDKAIKCIEVEHFVPDDAPGKRIYRADVTLSYYL